MLGPLETARIRQKRILSKDVTCCFPIVPQRTLIYDITSVNLFPFEH